MNMKKIIVTTLVENYVITGAGPVIAEHGLCFFIQAGRKNILFDTGQGMALRHNADILGIDLAAIDTVVLSHGHYDHAGGLRPLSEINKNFELIGHPSVFDDKLACTASGCRSIGLGSDREFFTDQGICVRLSDKPEKIAENIFSTGEIPQTTDFEGMEPYFFINKEGGRVPDTMPDDNALVIDTAAGLVIIFGCAHRGAANTLYHVRKIFGGKKISAILGGLHLISASREKVEKLGNVFDEFNIEKMIVGHCTGFEAAALLRNRFGGRVAANRVGLRLEL